MITRSVGAQLRRPSRRGAQRSLSGFSRVSQGTAAFPPSVLYPEGEESIRLHRSGTGEPLLATAAVAGLVHVHLAGMQRWHEGYAQRIEHFGGFAQPIEMYRSGPDSLVYVQPGQCLCVSVYCTASLPGSGLENGTPGCKFNQWAAG